MKTFPIEIKNQAFFICTEIYKKKSNMQKNCQWEGVTLVAAL